MNDYTIVALITVASAIILPAIVKWRYGNGIMTRLSRVVIISLCTVGYIAFVLGKIGITTLSLVISVSIVVALVLMMVVVIQRTIIDRLQIQADAVARVVNNLSATSSEAAVSAEEQASAVTQVSTAVEEIHQMSQNTANTSQDVANVAGQAFIQGQEGLDSVREALLVMERLSQATDFVEVVNQVAEQSNLLAFNAGIEAAKAEEYGRGFSVVASEVRNLAEQSKQAANQIRDSIRHTEAGQKAIKTTDSVITGLGSVLQETSDKAHQISSASIQQAAGIKQISDAMVNLIQSGKHTAMTSLQIKEAATELAKVTDQLSLLIHGVPSSKAEAKNLDS
jgi:methyl-accepting chemotaxis protein